MSDFGKWTFRILVVLLAVAIIDLNFNQPNLPAAGLSVPKGMANLALGVALALVLLVGGILGKKPK